MGRYTLSEDPRVDVVVERHLQRIVTEVLRLQGGVEAILLAGGFGRGEGSAVCDASRCWPLNDYDIVIVSRDEVRAPALACLGQELAKEFSLDFVDLGVLRADQIHRLKPTLFNYDLKYGSQVIHGNPGVTRRMPNFSPGQIPPAEALELLLNRMAGLLGSFTLGPDHHLVPRTDQYFENQVIKAILACGDALVLRAGRYHHLYRQRRQSATEIGSTGQSDWLPLRSVRRMDEAYAAKLSPGTLNWTDARDVLLEWLPVYERVFLRCASWFLSRPVATVWRGCHGYLRRYGAAWRVTLRGLVASTTGVPARHVAYACLPLALFSLTDPNRSGGSWRREAWRLLRRIEPDLSPGQDWDALRQACFGAWGRHCHG